MAVETPVRKQGTWSRLQSKLILGLLTILPLAVVWYVVSFLVGLLSWAGRPLVDLSYRYLGLPKEGGGSWWQNDTVATLLAVIVSLWIIYIIGAAASNVLGASPPCARPAARSP